MPFVKLSVVDNLILFLYVYTVFYLSILITSFTEEVHFFISSSIL
jgi:hypothetical protein